IYRYFIHPLAQIPGPKFAALTDLYAAYEATCRRLHLTTLWNHQQYGSVFRAGPNRVIFNTVSALQSIYIENDLAKSKCFEVMTHGPEARPLFCLTDKEESRLRRKAVSSGLSDRNLRDFEDEMVGQIDMFLRHIIEPRDASINLTPPCKYLGFDIISLYLSGKCLKMLTLPDKRAFVKLLAAFNHQYYVCLQNPVLSRLYLTTFLYPSIAAARVLRNIWGKGKRVESRKLERPNGRKSLLLYMTSAYNMNSGRKLSETIISAESSFLLDAGGSTTGTTLAALFFYLSRNRECYDKVVSEISSTFSSASNIRIGPLLSSCNYLRACIEEALRMSPPIGGTVWREARSSGTDQRSGAGGIIIDGHFIPEGTEVGVSIYCLHHNETYFKEPFRFWPERWLPDSQSPEDKHRERLHRMRKAFLPFGAGTRSCPGRSMAIMEISLTMAKVLWYFDFHRTPGKGQSVGREREDEFQIRDITTAMHDGPYLNFECRDDRWTELYTY
ncbi:cytochrome P450, partial [Rhizodiscina lignyota]